MGKGSFMKEYTEQETRFFEKLGITPGPWVPGNEQYNYAEKPSEIRAGYPSSGFNKTRRCLFSGNVYFQECYANAKFAAHAPDMFLICWKHVLTLKQTFSKTKNWSLFHGNYLTNIIEKSTGKTFQQLIELWEECAE